MKRRELLRSCALGGLCGRGLPVALAVLPGRGNAQDGPRLVDVWARATVAGQDMGGAFLRIVGGRQADRLLGASSPLAMAVELHSMRMEGDVMRMRAVEHIDVPAGQTVALSPGGFHLMLMGLNEPLRPGMQLPLVLRFQKAGEVPVQAEVMLRPPPGRAPP